MPNPNDALPGRIETEGKGLPKTAQTNQIVYFVLGDPQGRYGWLGPSAITTEGYTSSARLPESYFVMPNGKRRTSSNINDILSPFVVKKPDLGTRHEIGKFILNRFTDTESTTNNDFFIDRGNFYPSSQFKKCDDTRVQALGQVGMFSLLGNTDNDFSFETYSYTTGGAVYSSSAPVAIYTPTTTHTGTKAFKTAYRVQDGTAFSAIGDQDNRIPIVINRDGMSSRDIAAIRSLNDGAEQQNATGLFLAKTGSSIVTAQYALDLQARYALARKENPGKGGAELKAIAEGYDFKNEKLQAEMKEFHGALIGFRNKFSFTGKLFGDNNDNTRLADHVSKLPAGSPERVVAESILDEQKHFTNIITALRQHYPKGAEGGKYDHIHQDTIDIGVVMKEFEQDNRFAIPGESLDTGYFWLTRFSGLDNAKLRQLADPISVGAGFNSAKTMRFISAQMNRLSENGIVNLGELGDQRNAGIRHFMNPISMVRMLAHPDQCTGAHDVTETALYLAAAHRALFVVPETREAKVQAAFQHLSNALAAFNNTIGEDDINKIIDHISKSTHTRELERYGIGLSDMVEIRELLTDNNDTVSQTALNDFRATYIKLMNDKGIKKGDKNVLGSRQLALVGSNVEIIEAGGVIRYYVRDGQGRGDGGVGTLVGEISQTTNPEAFKRAKALKDEFDGYRRSATGSLQRISHLGPQLPLGGDRPMLASAPAPSSLTLASVGGSNPIVALTGISTPTPVASLTSLPTRDPRVLVRPPIVAVGTL